VKGLSRLPVTEEIAGSNPVEHATINVIPSWYYFFVEIFFVETKEMLRY
jgi:hypothetical protein